MPSTAGVMDEIELNPFRNSHDAAVQVDFGPDSIFSKFIQRQIMDVMQKQYPPPMRLPRFIWHRFTDDITKTILQLAIGALAAANYKRAAYKGAQLLGGQLFDLFAAMHIPVNETAKNIFIDYLLGVTFLASGCLVNGLMGFYCMGRTIDNLREKPDELTVRLTTALPATFWAKFKDEMQHILNVCFTMGACLATMSVVFSSGDSLPLAMLIGSGLFGNIKFNVSQLWTIRISNMGYGRVFGLGRNGLTMAGDILVRNLRDHRYNLAQMSRRHYKNILGLIDYAMPTDKFIGAMVNLSNLGFLLSLTGQQEMADIATIQTMKPVTKLQTARHLWFDFWGMLASSGNALMTYSVLSMVTGNHIFAITMALFAAGPPLGLGAKAGDESAQPLPASKPTRLIAEALSPKAFKVLALVLSGFIAFTGGSNARVNYTEFTFSFLPKFLNMMVRYPMEFIAGLITTPFINYFVVVGGLLAESFHEMYLASGDLHQQKLIQLNRRVLFLEKTLEQMVPDQFTRVLDELLDNEYANKTVASLLRDPKRMPEKYYRQLPSEILQKLDTIPLEYHEVESFLRETTPQQMALARQWRHRNRASLEVVTDDLHTPLLTLH